MLRVVRRPGVLPWLWRLQTPAASLGQARCYSEEVHQHFKHPQNVGSFDKSEPNVGTAVVGKASCGDVIKLQVKVEDGIVRDARFKTFGCGSAIASSSLATELIKGRNTEDALKLKNTDISSALSLPPVKIHCSLLAEDAIHHAILDYQKRYPANAAASEKVAESKAPQKPKQPVLHEEAFLA
eukprot:GHVT01071625.1.p1 GENE.GHVT01071625.1~~GHVT01071625.1.p1  ORF type:complete len:183 (+),score=31.76 GHVT01071625.1:209-757(+)